MPFALANGVVAAGYYAGLECFVGLKAMSGQLNFAQGAERLSPALRELLAKLLSSKTWKTNLPLGGVAVGVLTALTAQFIWPIAISICWSPEQQDLFLGSSGRGTLGSSGSGFLIDLYNMAAIPIGVPVGISAGLAMHTVLQPLILGTVGAGGPGPAAAAFGVTCLGAGLYFAYSVRSADDYFWVERLDPMTGRRFSQNARSGKVEQTVDAAYKSEVGRRLTSVLAYLRRPIGTIWDRIISARTMSAAELYKQAAEGGQHTSFVPTGVEPALKLEQLSEYQSVFQTIDHLVRLERLHGQRMDPTVEVELMETALLKLGRDELRVDLDHLPVSYTHLTLPTKRIV
eukprot:TRINITY_DN21376_c0_g1_i2.p1 TRINITY_DN21376_c0_g1~~TRINITY_DN21376_c0_g1_i2.p1  ORF type:complete len:344 (-),score=75.24 TRINITY_DN21376_c0_g1_i2:93-1124(-)